MPLECDFNTSHKPSGAHPNGGCCVKSPTVKMTNEYRGRDVKIKKVMMVDDDLSIRKVAEISLRKVGGWEVILCDSAEAGLEALNTEHPDVILLDVMMPQVGGVTAFPDFQRKTNNNTPIIFMTAKVMSHEIGCYLDMGAAGVISKPFEVTRLPEEISSIAEAFERKNACRLA